jgi:hypothetical protein
MGPFGSGDGTFNRHMIDLSIVVSSLSLIVKVSVVASDDSEDCAVGGKVVSLLRILMNL